MIRNTLIAVCICLMVLCPAVFAQKAKKATKSAATTTTNNQTVVIGGGLGLHLFSDLDDTRQGSDTYDGFADVFLAGQLRLFGEWFVFDKFGFGGIFNHQTTGRTYSGETQTWTIQNFFATVNFIPFGGQGYTRMGLYAGYGTSRYTMDSDSSAATYSFYSAGPAYTLGIYFDWGGDGFGMRMGHQYIMTSLPDIETSARNYQVSASGNTFHYDFRWAF